MIRIVKTSSDDPIYRLCAVAKIMESTLFATSACCHLSTTYSSLSSFSRFAQLGFEFDLNPGTLFFALKIVPLKPNSVKIVSLKPLVSMLQRSHNPLARTLMSPCIKQYIVKPANAQMQWYANCRVYSESRNPPWLDKKAESLTQTMTWHSSIDISRIIDDTKKMTKQLFLSVPYKLADSRFTCCSILLGVLS